MARVKRTKKSRRITLIYVAVRHDEGVTRRDIYAQARQALTLWFSDVNVDWATAAIPDDLPLVRPGANEMRSPPARADRKARS